MTERHHRNQQAAQGSAETNLIRWRIQQILPLIKGGKATLILLDPKDVLTRELPTLARQMGLEDRSILIDPLESPVSFRAYPGRRQVRRCPYLRHG